jgi:hypothetical protein
MPAVSGQVEGQQGCFPFLAQATIGATAAFWPKHNNHGLGHPWIDLYIREITPDDIYTWENTVNPVA